MDLLLDSVTISSSQLRESDGYSFCVHSSAEIERLLVQLEKLGYKEDDGSQYIFKIIASDLSFTDIREISNQLKDYQLQTK